jgi:hypothetical protein
VTTPDGDVEERVTVTERAQVGDESTLRTVYRVSGDASVAPVHSGGRHVDYGHELYADGETLYEYVPEGESPSGSGPDASEVTETAADRPGADYTFFGTVEADFRDVRLLERESVDGRDLFWLGRSYDPSPREDGYLPRRVRGVVAAGGTFQVLSERRLRRRADGDGRDVVESSVRFSRVGETAVDRPEWL